VTKNILEKVVLVGRNKELGEEVLNMMIEGGIKSGRN